MVLIDPPAYPRIPYLFLSPEHAADGNFVPSSERERWFKAPVVVEEKMDGANVSLWMEDGAPRVAGRGGSGAMDRAGQLGRLRAWVGGHAQALNSLLGREWVLYGEWLWLTHSIRYDRLPDWLVALDLWSASTGFLSTSSRNERLQAAGLTAPPQLFCGILGSPEKLQSMLGPSAFGDEQAEGVVVRRDDTGQRCKVVAAGFQQVDDASWARGRGYNALSH
jgi:hypothetical protein